MAVTIEFLPETEDRLAMLAAAEGLSLAHYVRRLLEDQFSDPAPAAVTPAERARIWRDSVKGLPRTAPLSEEAVSRESFYDARG